MPVLHLPRSEPSFTSRARVILQVDRRALAPLVGGVFLVFLLLPLVSLLGSLQPAGLARALTPGLTANGSAIDPLRTSVLSTAVSISVIVALGTPLAYTLARARFPQRQILEFLLLIPLAMPPLVVGLLLVGIYGPYGPIGALLGGDGRLLVNSFWGLCLAQTYEAAPYYVLAAQAAFSQVDGRIERTSLLLGTGPWGTFRRVTLPLAAPGLGVGVALAAARALGAFGAVIVIAYHPYSLPLAVWIGLQELGVPQAMPVAFVLVAVALPIPLLTALWSYRAQRRAYLPPS